MSSISRISDEEVSCAIRYLDPDLYEDAEWHDLRQMSRFGWCVRVLLATVAVGAVVYFTVLRFLPTLIRLAR